MKNPRSLLRSTTALIGVAALGLWSDPAHAINYFVGTPSGTSIALVGDGSLLGTDTLTVGTNGVIGTVNSAVAINAGQYGGFIDNSGTISTSSTSAYAINIIGSLDYTSADASYFVNQSSALITGTRRGMSVTGVLTDQFLNNGTIQGGIVNGVTQSGVALNFNRGLNISGGAADFTTALINNGVIAAYATNNGAIGIQFNLTNTDISQGLTNSGTIQALCNCATAYGMRISSGDFAGDIVNNSNGIILGNGTSGAAIHLQSSAASLTGTLFNNGGTISSTNAALWAVGGAFDGGISNSGTITGDSRGVYLQSGADINGGFLNSGRLYGGTVAAIEINGSGSRLIGGLTNSGTIETSPGGYALLLVSGTLQGGFRNSGSITGDVRANNGQILDGINNTGTIIGTFDIFGAAALIAGDFINDGYLYKNSGTNIIISGGGEISDGITNNGTIAATGNMIFFSSGGGRLENGFTNNGTVTTSTAFLLLGPSEINGGITNTGLMESSLLIAQANISSTGSGAFISFNPQNITGGIVNTGTMDSGSGLISLRGSSVSGGINNAGIMLADQTVFELGAVTASGGVHVQTSSIAGGITNSGTIAGLKAFSFTAGSDLIGGLTNAGMITGTSGTAIELEGLDSIFDMTLDGGRIIGDIVDQEAANGFSAVTVTGAFTTDGNITVSNMGIDNSCLTISSADLITTESNAIGNSGTLAIEIADNNNFGRWVINNGAFDLSGLTITANVLDENLLTVGTAMKIVDGFLSVMGGPGPTGVEIADNSTLLKFLLVDGAHAGAGTDDTDLFLLTQQARTISDAAQGENNRAIAPVLDALDNTTDPVLLQILNNLNAASTDAEINDILASLLPGTERASAEAALFAADKTINLTQMRLSSLRTGGSGIASGEKTDKRAWAQIYGQVADQNARSGAAAFDMGSYGFALGADTDRIEDIIFGVAFGYSETDIDFSDINRTATNIKAYQAGVYGDYDIVGNLFLSGALLYSYNMIDNVRNNINGTAFAAEADYSASQYSARVETGYDLIEGNMIVTPKALIHYTHYDPDDYRETGAGGASLVVGTESLNILEAGIGVEAKWTVYDRFEPALHAGYRYDMIGDAIQTTSRFAGGGASFVTSGSNPARHNINGGAGLTFRATETASFTAAYDIEHKDEYTAHSGVLRAAVKF